MLEAMTLKAGMFPGLNCEDRPTWERLMAQQDRLREAAVEQYLQEMLGMPAMRKSRKPGRN